MSMLIGLENPTIQEITQGDREHDHDQDPGERGDSRRRSVVVQQTSQPSEVDQRGSKTDISPEQRPQDKTSTNQQPSICQSSKPRGKIMPIDATLRAPSSHSSTSSSRSSSSHSDDNQMSVWSAKTSSPPKRVWDANKLAKVCLKHPKFSHQELWTKCMGDTPPTEPAVFIEAVSNIKTGQKSVYMKIRKALSDCDN